MFRVGRQLGRTIYRDDKLIGLMDCAEDAAMVVKALNDSARIRELEASNVAMLEHNFMKVQEMHLARIRELESALREVCGIAKDWSAGRSGKVHARIDELWERGTGTKMPSGPQIK